MKKVPLKRKTPMKRTGFKKKEYIWAGRQSRGRLIVVTPRKPRKRIKQKSDKRIREEKEYNKLRKEFLVMHNRCAACHCAGPPYRNLDVHHKARRGKHYLNQSTWVALCRGCHSLVESNPKWAMENGFLLTPEQRRLLA